LPGVALAGVAGFQVEGLNAKPPIVRMPVPSQLSSAG
jgi:hypothetical protein